jgi:hypothetical protein
VISELNVKEKDFYEVAIDKHIIDILKNHQGKTSGQLKRELDYAIKRVLSPPTFSTHLSNLIRQKLVQKYDLGRGKTVSYSLTDLARKKFELGLLGDEKESIERYRRVYNAIFFYHVLYYFPKILYSDEEFRQVLTKLGVKENELEWGLMTFGADNSPYIAYGKDEHFEIGRQPLSLYKKMVKKYWRARPGLSTVLTEIKLICYPCKDNLEIFMERIEQWEINKNTNYRKYLTEYHIHLCGFSVNDIVNITGEDYEVVNEAFTNLKMLGLIDVIINFGGELKYRFKDKDLENLFAALWTMHKDGEFWLLLKKWSYFDKPTQVEFDRLERLFGKVESERIKRLCERTRSNTIVALRKSRTIHEFIKCLVQNREIPFMDSSSTITNGYQEYALYLKENDPVKYKEEIPLQTQKWCESYKKTLIEEYKDEPIFSRALERLEIRRGQSNIVSKKDKIKQVREFYQILKTIEYEYLKSLPYDIHGNILEDVKMEFENTISRYSFLDDIVKDICPQILDQPDYELQEKIINDEVEKQKGFVKFANELEIIYHDNGRWQNPKKSGKRIPYKMVRFRNNQTGKVSKIKVLDFD